MPRTPSTTTQPPKPVKAAPAAVKKQAAEPQPQKKATPVKARKLPAQTPRSTPPTIEADPLWIADVVRKNVRLLKGLRGLSDEEITRRGRYTSRQVYHNRMNGPVDFSSEDFARIAAALDVEPAVLLLPPAEVVQWAEDHPDFHGPAYRQQSARKGVEEQA